MYDLRSMNLPPAVAEFAIEMRALSVLERAPRRKRVPLRLLRDVAWHATTSASEQLWHSDLVPDALADTVGGLLTGFERAWHSWHIGSLSDGDFLEAQHSLITNLALTLDSDTRTSDKFPALVAKLNLDPTTAEALERLGTRRNGVKHRGDHAHAKEYAEEALPWVLRTVENLTGVDLDPLAPEVAALSEDPETVFRPLPMYWRSGERRVVRR